LLSSRSDSKLSELSEQRERESLVRLNNYLTASSKRERQLQKFAKEQLKQRREKSAKSSEKFLTVSQNLQHLRSDTRELEFAIQQKQRHIQNAINSNQRQRLRNVMLRQEREHLRLGDTQRLQQLKEWQLEQRKARVLSKHLQLTANLHSAKQREKQRQEFVRQANHLRLRESELARSSFRK
jgi:hypothetical protein